MTRYEIITRIGKNYNTSNIEGGEYSYVKEAGSKEKLRYLLGDDFEHYKLDIRFEYKNIVVLVETKQNFDKNDELQLKEYVKEERAIHPNVNIIAILANTSNDKIRVWKNSVNDAYILKDENILDTMEHYVKLYESNTQNDRETVLKNTYALNEMLHKFDIRESLRSQFVGTTLLFIKEKVKSESIIDSELCDKLNEVWRMMEPKGIIGAIESTLDNLLDGSVSKEKKVELLRLNVLTDQKVCKLSIEQWIEILDTILLDIYRYINADSSEGQDILNMFFIAFNKYTGRADKNQAFTPDHITDFMCKITEVDQTKVIFDGTCGSGSFLVQAMVKEFADCRKGNTERRAKELINIVKKKHIYGIEYDDKVFGLATTNMLIHGDGNSNIICGDIFENADYIKKANPDIILMNPPYNAKPMCIPAKYKENWSKSQLDGKDDATKGFCFVQFVSDVIRDMNEERMKSGKPRKTAKMAVLLPVSVAIGNNKVLKEAKKSMLKDNRLEAVFTLPSEIFYPGAAVSACCMVFTLGIPHFDMDGNANKTFFGYYKEDGFKKKKNLGRVEQFDANGDSKWKAIESRWISLFNNKESVDGLSATAIVDGDSEWLCEAYMKTDYSLLTEVDFQQTINNYLAYLVKEGIVYED